MPVFNSPDEARSPREVFADLDFANKRINEINGQIQELCRMRRIFENSVDKCRSELKAMAEPDGHLPNCSRSDRCLGDGWCRP